MELATAALQTTSQDSGSKQPLPWYGKTVQELFFDNRESGVDLEGNPISSNWPRPMESKVTISNVQQTLAKY